MNDDATREDPSSPAGGRGGLIPPYRLLEKLGEGGMGEVWLAEQSEPVKRRVAIKVIKAGMDTKRVIARFEAERQALAVMDHPTIAKVFDAGETPRGLPFFAMEYVRGEMLTSYCDRHRLTNEARLRLFLEVCAGVQHAHQKGIIHRDLKPGNVLVAIQDDRPVPKIIDFGVAKATAQRLTEKTLHTELGVMIGTPEYMSPEQAEMSGLDVDTRTDVYSLGVMLYQLLTGALPFDMRELRAAGLDEIRRQIREVDPPRPSMRVSTMGQASTEVAERRQTDSSRLASRLEGDLDWIAMKAIEKDRTRRYGSPSELASDIVRYLADEPVVARPPSATYRAGKFVKRHRFGVGAAALGVVALVAFGLAMAFQARRIANERDRAERVSEFLTDMFRFANPATAHGETITARDLLDRGAARIESELADQPLVRAQLMSTMGSAYHVLGLCNEASRLLQSAVDTLLDELGPDDPLTLESMADLGGALACAGKTSEAETCLRQVVDRGRSARGSNVGQMLVAASLLAGVLSDLKRTDEAEALYRETLERSRTELGPDHEVTLSILSDLSNLAGARDPAEGVALVRELIPRIRSTVGEDAPLFVLALANLAHYLALAGDVTGAATAGEDALPRARRIMGDAAEVTTNVMGILTDAYLKQGRYDEAEKLASACVDNLRQALGPDHAQTLMCTLSLANVYFRQQRYADAVQLRRDVLAARRRTVGEDHPLFVVALAKLAYDLSSAGEYNEAEKLAGSCVDRLRQALGPDDARTLVCMDALTDVYLRQQRYADAERLRRDVLAAKRRTLGESDPEVADRMYNLACTTALQGKRDESLAWLRQSVEHGYANADWMTKDTDLTSLHGDPRFEALVAEARKKAPAARPGP